MRYGWSCIAVALVLSFGGAAGAEPMATLEARCADRDLAACTTIAELYTFGTHIKRDLPRASAAWQRVCDLGNKIGCPRARSLAKLVVDEAACERTGHADRCFAAGLGYAEFDRRAALPGLERACRAGRQDACSYQLRAKVLLGDARAIDALERRCLVEDRVDDCVQVARHLGPEDPGRTLPILDKACALDSAEACLALGRALRDRRAPIEQIQSRFDAACRLGGKRSDGCREAAAQRRESGLAMPMWRARRTRAR